MKDERAWVTTRLRFRSIRVLIGPNRQSELEREYGVRIMGHHRDGRDAPERSGDIASSGPPNYDQAFLRRRGALVGRSAASSVFRLRPPLTGSNKAG